MNNITFHSLDYLEDYKIDYVVIISRHNNQWLLCKHKERSTWEIPGGKCEFGETHDEAARRELYEETGAIQFQLQKLFVFLANDSYGLVYFADIDVLDVLPDSEMEKIDHFDSLENLVWTYPNMQPYVFQYFLENF